MKKEILLAVSIVLVSSIIFFIRIRNSKQIAPIPAPTRSIQSLQAYHHPFYNIRFSYPHNYRIQEKAGDTLEIRFADEKSSESSIGARIFFLKKQIGWTRLQTLRFICMRDNPEGACGSIESQTVVTNKNGIMGIKYFFYASEKTTQRVPFLKLIRGPFYAFDFSSSTGEQITLVLSSFTLTAENTKEDKLLRIVVESLVLPPTPSFTSPQIPASSQSSSLAQ